ncbi:expressed unknown protein [Seminavis robusta]|uniref:Uncharacterized protein n=1 Tax=Seminavis robusta TaxID=568900 RepID=A0A9N8HB91_9STRA|nr:expressed unknown protein [Seminavis robusta]|eukprot:Sro353_g124380.1 n/a (241) ;mRNA; f:3017-3739
MPVVDQTEKDVVDMAASSCCSDDDSSFCSMDASCSDDSSFSFDSVSDEDMSIASIANDDADDDADGLAKIELPQIIEALSSNRLDFTVLDLCVPIEKEEEVSDLLQAIRSNTTVTTCSIGSGFFDSLSERWRRELADSICSHSGLKSLSMDHSFPEFLYYFNCCRCWKRDQYYRQHQRYWEFQNQSIQEIRIRDMPADIAELPLGRIVMMTLCNFVSLERLEITWADEFTRDMAVLMRVA